MAFASEILAHLPYTALNDPLFIVYNLSCITALDGQTIIYNFAQLLGGDLCDPNSEEDDIERAAKQKKGKFDPAELGLEPKSAEFGQLCVNACRVLPLLQLKNFLRKAYNLSEARMTEYVPSEKERIHEKGISISDSIPAFSCTVEPIFDGQQNINWNSAVRIYSIFRALMRDCEFTGSLLEFAVFFSSSNLIHFYHYCAAEADDLHVDTEATKTKSPRKGKRKREEDSDALPAQPSPKVSPE